MTRKASPRISRHPSAPNPLLAGAPIVVDVHTRPHYGPMLGNGRADRDLIDTAIKQASNPADVLRNAPFVPTVQTVMPGRDDYAAVVTSRGVVVLPVADRAVMLADASYRQDRANARQRPARVPMAVRKVRGVEHLTPATRRDLRKRQDVDATAQYGGSARTAMPVEAAIAYVLSCAADAMEKHGDTYGPYAYRLLVGEHGRVAICMVILLSAHSAPILAMTLLSVLRPAPMAVLESVMARMTQDRRGDWQWLPDAGIARSYLHTLCKARLTDGWRRYRAALGDALPVTVESLSMASDDDDDNGEDRYLAAGQNLPANAVQPIETPSACDRLTDAESRAIIARLLLRVGQLASADAPSTIGAAAIGMLRVYADSRTIALTFDPGTHHGAVTARGAEQAAIAAWARQQGRDSRSAYTRARYALAGYLTRACVELHATYAHVLTDGQAADVAAYCASLANRAMGKPA